MSHKDETSFIRAANIKEYFLSMIILCVVIMVGLDGCMQGEKFITKERVYQICYQQLKSLGEDTVEKYISFEPDHPITTDSIKDDSVSTAWAILDFSEWLNETGGKLNNAVFWICECRPKEPAMDGITEIYINAKSGEVLFIKGGGAEVTKWRKDHGLIEP